ncbi:unnamed protein product [Acanthoscelides obtectus]|uniref:Uncharacterized protein n=1 Tax=Acanthoscelides obtectus TaxID=200917 RepID=A0A9P0KTC2_ACAOB|nr:unnamed protein product [Acanthoscelides obtectus]CAK1681835.1 hypothetical protein AOBTE_LOCUS33301 [Acanthoscelides obtectus]
MAATVKKFRPDLATKAKSSVFKIITHLEIVNQQLLLPANEFHSDSYSSSSSPWTPHSSTEPTYTSLDIISEAFTQAIQNGDDN